MWLGCEEWLWVLVRLMLAFVLLVVFCCELLWEHVGVVWMWFVVGDVVVGVFSVVVLCCGCWVVWVGWV